MQRSHHLSLFSEIKQSGVFKAGIAYVIVVWLLAQIHGTHIFAHMRTSQKAAINVG